MMQELSCPACAAPLAIKNRFVKLVTCDFCGQVSTFQNSALDPTGRTAELAQLPSRLFVDAQGTLNGRSFTAAGRLRYQYDAGYWDEWFLVFDNDKPGWLVEDEGNLSFFVKQTISGDIPPYESIHVGSAVTIADRQVFVTEKGEATIAGGEGQLAFTIMPGEVIQYVDGSSGDKQVSVEYAADEVEFLVGIDVQPEQLVVEEDEF